MNHAEQNNTRLEIIWKFVRGDLEPTEFEQWAYAETGLEDQLGEQLYMETISADYSSTGAVYVIRQSLKVYAREATDIRCECVTLSDLADVGMGKYSNRVFKTFDQRAKRGDPFWWLLLYECTECGQWWFVAQEERHNDVFFLKRLLPREVRQILNEHRWPEDFDKYETLLRLGHERGHSVVYVDPLDSSLIWTAADLARERPGIRVSELAELLNLDIHLAKLVAEKAMKNEGVVIDLE